LAIIRFTTWTKNEKNKISKKNFPGLIIGLIEFCTKPVLAPLLNFVQKLYFV